jgi:hypothetical protein
MDENFERWARAEIERLRLEANTLEHALSMYRKSAGQPSQFRAPEGMAPPPPLPRTRGRQAGSKTQGLLAIVREAGPRGIDLDAIYTALKRRGIEMPKNTVRSVLYFGKKRGNLLRRDDGSWCVNENGPGSANPSPLS